LELFWPVFDYFSAAEAFPDRGLITVKNPKANDREPPKNFSFDAVFAADVTQKDIYNTCAASVVESVLGGYNGTIFAYGQVFNVFFPNLTWYKDRSRQNPHNGRKT
jgi:hypothetical protein